MGKRKHAFTIPTGNIPYVFDLYWDLKNAEQCAAKARDLRNEALRVAESYTHLVAEMKKHGMGGLVKDLPQAIKVIEVCGGGYSAVPS